MTSTQLLAQNELLFKVADYIQELHKKEGLDGAITAELLGHLGHLVSKVKIEEVSARSTPETQEPENKTIQYWMDPVDFEKEEPLIDEEETDFKWEEDQKPATNPPKEPTPPGEETIEQWRINKLHKPALRIISTYVASRQQRRYAGGVTPYPMIWHDEKTKVFWKEGEEPDWEARLKMKTKAFKVDRKVKKERWLRAAAIEKWRDLGMSSVVTKYS